MKSIKLIPALVFILYMAASCTFVSVYEPVYLSYDALRSSVVNQQPAGLKETGKIYLKDQYLFINEKNKGVHVIDNSNPAHPQIITFIAIPGNIDIAIKDNILYADSYIDLIALDISNPLSVVEKARIKDAFPFRYEYYYQDTMMDYANEYSAPDKTKGIVIAWKKTKTEISPILFYAIPDVMNAGTGTAGSMACFTLVGDYLYTVDTNSLRLFNITNPLNPVIDSNMNIGWGIETIFPYNNKLFIGSTTGMFIYDISDPLNPLQLSQFTHATSCDPVVIQGHYAYITLRSGTRCNNGVNELKIVDITDITAPVEIKTYIMNNPFGLGVDGNTLFICDNTAGLKVYDCTDPLSIIRKNHFTEHTVYDVIPHNGVAVVIGAGGLYQYDYSNPDDVKLISSIAINQ